MQRHSQVVYMPTHLQDVDMPTHLQGVDMPAHLQGVCQREHTYMVNADTITGCRQPTYETISECQHTYGMYSNSLPGCIHANTLTRCMQTNLPDDVPAVV